MRPVLSLISTKDPELWIPDGDCLVHLYGRGQSRRGPAFRLPMASLVAAGCYSSLERFVAKSASSPSACTSHSCSSSESYFSESGTPAAYELYIPIPESAPRDQAFLYHIATRNFFAWILRRPLVGVHLGGALVGLFNSMKDLRGTADNVSDIMTYMQEVGYSDLRNSPDHALGVLFFAEQFHFRDLWIDAFAHCAGMNDRIFESSEFEVCLLEAQVQADDGG